MAHTLDIGPNQLPQPVEGAFFSKKDLKMICRCFSTLSLLPRNDFHPRFMNPFRPLTSFIRSYPNAFLVTERAGKVQCFFTSRQLCVVRSQCRWLWDPHSPTLSCISLLPKDREPREPRPPPLNNSWGLNFRISVGLRGGKSSAVYQTKICHSMVNTHGWVRWKGDGDFILEKVKFLF